jgi:Polyketide cyclase / dehydrase and lipid transport
VSKVRAARTVMVPREEAEALWLDVRRWATFIEGFGHEFKRDDDWPAEGSTLVWESRPGGRGRVTEKVVSRNEHELSTRVLEESLSGIQTVAFHLDEEAGTVVELSLEYHLNPTNVWRSGPLGKVVNLLFIRRAMADSLGRTLRRFATEAEEQQSL